MLVCQRCIRLFLWRPLSPVLQESKYTLNRHTVLQLLSINPSVCRSPIARQETVRFFTDHQTPSPDLTLKDVGKRVPFQTSGSSLASSTEFPADGPSFGLDAVPHLSPLQEISDEEAVQIQIPSILPPESYTLRPYVEKSETLRELLQIGVNLYELEQRPNVGTMLLRLDFTSDVAPRLLFLKDLGVQENTLGHIITKNPFILTESLDNLKARVSYLKSQKFSLQSVSVMVSKAPYLLNFSVERLDNRLSFFHQRFGLSAEKTRNIVSRLPKLLCGSLEPVKENLKVFELEFGFRSNEIQHIITVVPKLLIANKRKLTQTFDFVHNSMNVPQRLIAKFPQVLRARFLRLRERHMFLEFLGRAQYDPSQPSFIALDRLVFLPDELFCSEIALATVEDFERFQKTL